MNTLIMILIGTFALFLLFYALKLLTGKIRESMDSLVAVQFDPEDVLKQEHSANFMGQESKGMGQVRGNGALILTHTDLHFILAIPRRSWVIPLVDITKVSFPKSHLGKTKFKPLLRVDYMDNGQNDAIAWLVSDLEDWTKAIEEAKSNLQGKKEN
jgi:hypothetical protein